MFFLSLLTVGLNSTCFFFLFIRQCYLQTARQAGVCEFRNVLVISTAAFSNQSQSSANNCALANLKKKTVSGVCCGALLERSAGHCRLPMHIITEVPLPFKFCHWNFGLSSMGSNQLANDNNRVEWMRDIIV